MKTSDLKTTLVLLLSLIYSSYCQTHSTSIKEESYDWRLSISGGITYNFDERLNTHTSLNYLEYGAGYFINSNHEIGIKLGKNDFIGNPLALTGLSYTASDTIPIYEITHGLYEDIWYGLYYRFNYHSWYGAILLGGLTGFSYEYTSISIGREYRLSSLLYINAGLSYSLKTSDYKYVHAKQLTLTACLSLKL